MRIMTPLSISLFCLVLSACKEPPAPETLPVLNVSYLPIAHSVSSQYREFIGQVEPAELTPLAFRISGELDKVLVKSGQQVKQGQALASLDNRELQQKLQDAQAQQELAEKQFQRAESLLAQKLLSPAEYDELQAQLKLAKIQTNVAQSQVDYSRLTAPFSGTITIVNKDNYENIAAGEVILQMHQSQWLDVKIQLPNQIMASFKPNKAEAGYQPDVSFGKQPYLHQIQLQEHTLQPAPESEAFEARFRMPQPSPAILPGTTATIKMDLLKAGLSDQQGFLLPLTAIDSGRQSDQFLVWKWVDDKAIASPITVVQVTPQGALVSAGVHLGDKIITSHLNQLRNGMSVQATQEH